MKQRGVVHGPHFLGIGAPRCGTSWLHGALRRHPQLWLPPIKEVHYFDSIDPSIGDGAVDQWWHRVKTRLPRRLAHYPAGVVNHLFPQTFEKAKPDVDWDLRYFAPGNEIDWYLRLFDEKARRYKRVGEITPRYFSLSSEIIGRIKRETKIDKIILLLRDPMECAWSGFGRKIRERQNISDPDAPEQVIDEILGIAIEAQLYGRNLSRWQQHFSDEQVFIGFYEDLAARPEQLLDDICSFLEVDSFPSQAPHSLASKVNSSSDFRCDIPREIELAIARRLEPDLQQLAGMVGGPTLNWHARARRVVADAEVNGHSIAP